MNQSIVFLAHCRRAIIIVYNPRSLNTIKAEKNHLTVGSCHELICKSSEIAMHLRKDTLNNSVRESMISISKEIILVY